MPIVERLDPADYRRIPWKNGRGEMVVIDAEGAGWDNKGIAWHFGRTAIVEEGPFSDYTGYERLQVVIAGAGLVLVTPGGEIDLRRPLHPRRYDGGLPVRTVLEQGRVEVVNLIADRARFEIDLRVATAGAVLPCSVGRHLIYAPADPAEIEIQESSYALPRDQALRVLARSQADMTVRSGSVVVGSIRERA